MNPKYNVAPGLKKFSEEHNLAEDEIAHLFSMWQTTRGDKNFSQETWKEYLKILRSLGEDLKGE